MSRTEREILEKVLEATQSMGDLLGQLGGRVKALEEAMPSLEKSLSNAVADGAISTVFIGMLLADIPGGDQARFDQLMAKTVIFAEEKVGHLQGETRRRILACIDRIVGVAEDHFARER